MVSSVCERRRQFAKSSRNLIVAHSNKQPSPNPVFKYIGCVCVEPALERLQIWKTAWQLIVMRQVLDKTRINIRSIARRSPYHIVMWNRPQRGFRVIREAQGASFKHCGERNYELLPLCANRRWNV